MIFQPDEIKLMGSALDEVTIILPEMRTAAMKAKLASRILAAAAKGERDPNKLRIAALLGACPSSHWSSWDESDSLRGYEQGLSTLED
jgi:hypothetical protein